ncbi:MAG: Gfo/Idh/MocA family oxidoreductase [Chitinophagaceae bacterium]
MSYSFAIVGCGRIGERHARHIANRGSLLSVCDIQADRALALATQYKAAAYTSLPHLLQATVPDIVSVCTPNGLHAEHSIMALEAGCHVLCEKPMALTVHDARQMLNTAQKYDKQLFVVKQNRYNPPVAWLKDLIATGKLGQIYSFHLSCCWNRTVAYYNDNWRGTSQLDGGTLFTQFSHFIDLLYWLLGDVLHVQGLRANYAHGKAIEFEDTGAALLQMQQGAMGTLHYTVNTYAKNMEGSLTLIGENGTVKIGGQYLNQLEFCSVKDVAPPQLLPGEPANNYGAYEGSMSNHDKVYDNLIRTMNDPSYPFMNAEDALKTVEIIEKIYAASPFIF